MTSSPSVSIVIFIRSIITTVAIVISMMKISIIAITTHILFHQVASKHGVNKVSSNQI